MTDYLLSVVLFLPLAGMLAILLLPAKLQIIRLAANVSVALTLLASVWLAFGFNASLQGFQFTERAAWIPAIGAQYLIGIDGISLLLVLLTTLISAVAVLASWNSANERPKLYYAMLLLLETSVIGVFVSLDLFLFYLFWDLVLIPMYFIIGVYGGPRRSYAAIKFFLYTLLGSVFLLLGFIGVYFQHGQATGNYTFDLIQLMRSTSAAGAQMWIFWALFLGFAVKVPMFPLHTWLPDAHVEAPTAGSVLLASLLLKMGTYGFLRFSLPLAPAASNAPGVVKTMAVLSIIAIIYGALVSLMQTDWKRLVAYSSVSHMGFCTLGIFALDFNGLTGSVIQQVNHGISTGLLFLLVGFMYDRRHTREISDYGGLAGITPVFATVLAITVFSSAGLPLLNGFVGEFTILSGAFAVNKAWAAFGVLGMVLSAAYLLWLYQRTMMGPIRYDVNRTLPDLSARERVIVMPLIAFAFAIGLYPAPLFNVLRPAVNGVVAAGAFDPMSWNFLVAPLLMALFGCATLLIAAFTREEESLPWLLWFDLAGQALIGIALFRQRHGGSLASFTNGIVWMAVLALLLTSYRYLEIVHENRGEYYALALFAQCGMYFMATGSDLVLLFVGLELTSISFYILVGFTRGDRRSNEAALKYLLLGGLSSGFVLYGFSLLYGVAGSTALSDVVPVLARNDPFGTIAAVTIAVGLLFKVSAAPFHNWAPDAYDGAPTPVTGYLSVASKIASFAVLMRFNTGSTWTALLTAAAVASLTVGSIAAITQERLKRLFAYSGIAHAGYALLGIISGSIEGVYMYLFVYAVMTLGAFAVLTSLRRRGVLGEEVSDLRGLSQSHPLHAALFAILLLSFAGIPPTAGFIGKYFIFAALIQTGHITLAVIASAYVVVSVYFYFRLVREMYLEPVEERQPLAASLGVRFALGATAAITVVLGLFPQPAVSLIRSL